MSIAIDSYTSSTKGTILRVPNHSVVKTRGLEEDSRAFSKSLYAQEIHPPIPVMSTGSLLQQELPRCLDMPIRLKGMDNYYVPDEWKALVPLIQQIAAVEHGSNPSVVEDYYTYITVDCSQVTVEGQQRRGGLHVDGFQGTRIEPKTKVTRNYVATSNGGTRFYPQVFKADIDDAIYNVFEGFDIQAKEPFIAGENTVYFMDAYSVHESGLASRNGLRTFFRMTYDYKIFDRAGNTKNSLLSYDWPMVARDVQSTLQTPPEYVLP